MLKNAYLTQPTKPSNLLHTKPSSTPNHPSLIPPLHLPLPLATPTSPPPYLIIKTPSLSAPHPPPHSYPHPHPPQPSSNTSPSNPPTCTTHHSHTTKKSTTTISTYSTHALLLNLPFYSLPSPPSPFPLRPHTPSLKYHHQNTISLNIATAPTAIIIIILI